MSEPRANAIQCGALVAAALSGTWRDPPPTPDLSSDDLALASPLLVATGGGACTWWALRGSPLRTSPAAGPLHAMYRLQALQADGHEAQLIRVLGTLREAGVEPLLSKGWAMARLYPRPGLRPYSDLDLYVDADALPKTRDALAALNLREKYVDLNARPRDLADRPFEELWRRSLVLPIGTEQVRVPCREDLLRQGCVHFLRHGARWPRTLCDVALLLETPPSALDWDYLLGGDPRRTAWVVTVLRLAMALLGARPVGQPPSRLVGAPPDWLKQAVLAEWGTERPRTGVRVKPSPNAAAPTRVSDSRRREFIHAGWHFWAKRTNPVWTSLHLGLSPNVRPSRGQRFAYAMSIRVKRFAMAGQVLLLDPIKRGRSRLATGPGR